MTKKCIEDYENGIKSGRGSGRFEHYTPWLTVRGVKSCAVKSRLYSLRFNRIFHLFSHGEVLAFYQYDWDDSIIEVREQFPLDPNITYQICKELKLLHPVFTHGGSVMTTDFVLTRRSKEIGEELYSAVQIKHDEDDIRNPRTYSKLEIEHQYWQKKGHPWKICLSKFFNPTFSTNLEFFYHLRNTPYKISFLKTLKHKMRTFLGDDSIRPRDLHNRTVKIGETSLNLAMAINILCAKKLWLFDIKNKLYHKCTLADFTEVTHVNE